MATVRLTSECRATPGGSRRIKVKELREWLTGIPDTAELDEVKEYRGHGLSEQLVFVGLKATWTEER